MQTDPTTRSRELDLDFSNDEVVRYSRHILLAELGGTGQARLRAARVLIVGAGGLGAPLALYLAAAGIGTIGLVDDDVVELSNLQRQVIHTTARIGQGKVASAASALVELNPLVRVRQHALRLDAANVAGLIARYDLVCDGSDNFATRYLLADACVLGAVTGVMGTLQATETIKEVLGLGEGLSGRVLIWDALAMRFHGIRLRPDPGCPLCGTHRRIHDLSAHGS